MEPRALEGYLGLTVFQTLCPLATHLALGGCLPLPALGENLGERAHVELYQVLWELGGGADSWALSLGPSVGRYLCLPVPHPAWPWLARVGAGRWTALPGGMWMTPERLSSLIWGSSLGGGGEAQGPKLFWGLVSVWLTTWVGEGRLSEPQVRRRCLLLVGGSRSSITY